MDERMEQHRARRRELHRLRKIVESLPHFGDEWAGKNIRAIIQQEDAERRTAADKPRAYCIEQCPHFRDTEKEVDGE